LGFAVLGVLTRNVLVACRRRPAELKRGADRYEPNNWRKIARDDLGCFN
jgi:hypothetical protein